MAQKIIERWRLAVLRVHLDLADRSPTVATSLVGYPAGSAETLWTRRYPLGAFGLDAAPPTALTVPADLRDAVVTTLVTDLNREAALWLRLVPPYGYLGAVPWEASLIGATNLPVLRVPDRLPAASDLGRIWRAVIAVSATPRSSRAAPYIRSSWAATYIRSLLGRLRTTVPAEVQVDVFADAGTVAALRRKESLGSWVRVHHPEDAEEVSRARSTNVPEVAEGSRRVAYSGPASGRAWADWIAGGLAGQAVRALHIVLDGAFDVDRPRLALSPDPNKPVARSKCAFVTSDNVLRVADAIGAGTLSFGSPPRNPADLATRMIADTIGQQRPGATIYSSIAQDPDGDALAQAHAFLIDRSGDLPIPRHPSLFAYAQPEQIQSALREAWPEPPDLPTSPGDDDSSLITLPEYGAHSGLEDVYTGAPTVPTWVAASDRYLGNQWADLAKIAASPTPTAKIKGAYDKGAAEALGELGEIVERHARS